MNAINRRRFFETSVYTAAAIGVGNTHLPAAKKLEEGFTSLFDGQTLKGWHKNPQRIGHGTGGVWQVEDNMAASC